MPSHPEKRTITVFNPRAASCGKFAAKPLLTHFKSYSQRINSKSDISKLLTFPALEFCDKNYEIKNNLFVDKTENPLA